MHSAVCTNFKIQIKLTCNQPLFMHDIRAVSLRLQGQIHKNKTKEENKTPILASNCSCQTLQSLPSAEKTHHFRPIKYSIQMQHFRLQISVYNHREPN